MNLARALKTGRSEGELEITIFSQSWTLTSAPRIEGVEKGRIRSQYGGSSSQSENLFKKMGTVPEIRPIDSWELHGIEMILQSQNRAMCSNENSPCKVTG